MKKWSVASALIACVLLLAASERPAGAAPQTAPPANYVAGELLVKFNRPSSAAQRTAMVNARRATRLRRFARLDIDHLRLPAGLSVEDAMAAFRAMPGVVSRAAELHPPRHPERAAERSVLARRQPVGPRQDSGAVGLDEFHHRRRQRHRRQHRHRRGLHASGSRRQHVAQPVEIPGNGIDDDGNGYVDDVYGIDTVNHDSNPDGRPGPRHAHGRHDRRGRQQQRRRGRRELEREDPGVQVPRRRRIRHGRRRDRVLRLHRRAAERAARTSA